jgi:hypothetical protein
MVKGGRTPVIANMTTTASAPYYPYRIVFEATPAAFVLK